MALISKNDLLYKNEYSWTAVPGDDPKVSGKPDSTKFSRHEGYEVLYLINHLASEWNFKQIALANKMEKVIKLYLPSNIQSQENVKNWLHSNWDNYRL